ncbi:hypothetical protein RFI_30523 [Reticulomyxa filosa]|uniref:Uncharacterized protein n=1 Tax=Reticulomyxa filosa TaxID=46433 RepID=X6LYA5_RETFI|nr:hypothetical protein RFI_30523 [Reticulomyxa filosa]|eukprot:ETO06868.1 hypothetical protein RFI_30523 [Reticulomyxa filosa]
MNKSQDYAQKKRANVLLLNKILLNLCKNNKICTSCEPIKSVLQFESVFFKESSMEQIQDIFSIIEKELISKVWDLCEGDVDEQELYLRQLLKEFGNKMDKTIILEEWKQCNRIYWDTHIKLTEFSSIYDINAIEEKRELKIVREMCLHILWNILSYPKVIKYRQINTISLLQNLKRKCDLLRANVAQVFMEMENFFKKYGFQKGNDENWYYLDHIQLLLLWECYQIWIYLQPIVNIPTTVCMLSNGKWKEFEIVFDYEYRRIVLLNKNNLKVKTLQVGNPKKSSLEFNIVSNTVASFLIILGIFVQMILEKEITYQIIAQLMISHFIPTKFVNYVKYEIHFYLNSYNPYSITLKQGLQHLKDQFQVRQESNGCGDESITFECKFHMCCPQISSDMNEDMLLNDIYKDFHYLNRQVYWKISHYFIVPYRNTINISTIRTNIPEDRDSTISSNRKPKFNPLLYECNFIKLRIIQDTVYSTALLNNNALKELLHEVIKNGYLIDLIPKKLLSKGEKKIKKQINYNENNGNELILNNKILTILNELKILYYNEIHKQMGYPLQLHQICAILLYCGKSCNAEFSYDQTKFQYSKWKYLDTWSQDTIVILHGHERREEESIELYCGLKKVRLENEKEIKQGFFISHVSTSDDIQVARMFRSAQGCILHFHPSMRRAQRIYSCDVSWISPFKHEREILFSRSSTYIFDEERAVAWRAKIESEDENTQMILLTWAKYDTFVQQTMYISKMQNYLIDLNLIYQVLLGFRGNIDVAIISLNLFEEWKKQPNNVKKYEEKKKEFIERRCCNHHINLFMIFLKEHLPHFKINHNKAWSYKCTPIEWATIVTAKYGLPFVEKTGEIINNNKKYAFVK